MVYNFTNIGSSRQMGCSFHIFIYIYILIKFQMMKKKKKKKKEQIVIVCLRGWDRETTQAVWINPLSINRLYRRVESKTKTNSTIRRPYTYTHTPRTKSHQINAYSCETITQTQTEKEANENKFLISTFGKALETFLLIRLTIEQEREEYGRKMAK